MALDGAAFGHVSQPSNVPGQRGKGRGITYPFRFIFRLFKRSVAGIVRAIAYHPVGSLIGVLVLGAASFGGYEVYRGGGLSLPIGQQQASAQSSATITPSPAAEDFIKGQTTFNAQLMWQSFSDDFKQRLASQGTSQQALQQQLDQRKQAGAKVDQVQYAGGVQTPEGSRVFMYVLTMEAPNNQGVAEAHYVLTVDQNDKIVNVE